MNYLNKLYYYFLPIGLALVVVSCKAPAIVPTQASPALPETFIGSTDTANTGKTPWKQFFQDPYLNDLIAAALQKNQELQITLQEIEIAKNDILDDDPAANADARVVEVRVRLDPEDAQRVQRLA